MKILAHRGLWYHEEEKNSLQALERAFSHGFGIETDIRDCKGEILISHNPIKETAPSLNELIEIWKKYAEEPVMALNIKADGLYLLDGIQDKNIFGKENCFFFDSSVPEQYIYLKRGYPIFTRSSEFEKIPVFLEKSMGIWLDQFTDCEHIINSLERFLQMGKLIGIISPELHGRDPRKLWEYLLKFKDDSKVMLCTDQPVQAKEFFNE